MEIEKVSNGYIVKTSTDTHIYARLDEVFDFMLLAFEGRAQRFGGELYGRVVIIDEAKP